MIESAAGISCCPAMTAMQLKALAAELDVDISISNIFLHICKKTTLQFLGYASCSHVLSIDD